MKIEELIGDFRKKQVYATCHNKSANDFCLDLQKALNQIFICENGLIKVIKGDIRNEGTPFSINLNGEDITYPILFALTFPFNFNDRNLSNISSKFKLSKFIYIDTIWEEKDFNSYDACWTEDSIIVNSIL